MELGSEEQSHDVKERRRKARSTRGRDLICQSLCPPPSYTCFALVSLVTTRLQVRSYGRQYQAQIPPSSYSDYMEALANKQRCRKIPAPFPSRTTFTVRHITCQVPSILNPLLLALLGT